MVEFEPVVEGAGGEHKYSGKAEDDVGEDGDRGGYCPKNENERTDADQNCTDQVGNGVKGFSDFCHRDSLLTFGSRSLPNLATR